LIHFYKRQHFDMTSEKFCLRWNDFESNISGAFRELREDKDFFDVTLACDDEQIQAHKVILSACSPFFRTVLRRNPHTHPLLYLKGVKYSDLQSVLNFMYHGEVNVAQEELNSFLAVAEELRVKGLTQNTQSSGTHTHTQNHSTKSSPLPAFKPRPPDPPARSRPAPPPSSRPVIQEQVEEEVQEVQVMPAVKSEVVQHPDFGDSSMEEVDGYEHQVEEYGEQYGDHLGEEQQGYGGVMGNTGPEGSKESEIDKQVEELSIRSSPTQWQCGGCGKQASQRGDLRKHIEAMHLLLSLPCHLCEAVYRTRHHRQHHLRTVHGLAMK